LNQRRASAPAPIVRDDLLRPPMHISPALTIRPQTQGRVARPLQPDLSAPNRLPPRSMLARLLPIKRLLMELDHPGSHSTPTVENDIRCTSPNAKSARHPQRYGRDCRDAFLGLAKTCASSPSPSGLSRCQADVAGNSAVPYSRNSSAGLPTPCLPEVLPCCPKWVQRAGKGWPSTRQTSSMSSPEPETRISPDCARTLNTGEHLSLPRSYFPALLGF